MLQTSNNRITVKIRKTTYSLLESTVAEMREWASDCTWNEDSYYDDDWMDEMSDEEIIRAVHRHYDGGINAFVRAM